MEDGIEKPPPPSTPSRDETQSFDVNEEIVRFRKGVSEFTSNAFGKAPTMSNSIEMSSMEYEKKHPQCTIFVPQRHLHLFPVVMQEASSELMKISPEEEHQKIITASEENLDHEFQHIQAVLEEKDAVLLGAGLQILNIDGKPNIRPFFRYGGDLKKSSLLKITTKPENLSVGDIRKAEELLLKKGVLRATIQILNDQELMDVYLKQAAPKMLKFYFGRISSRLPRGKY